MIVGAIIGGLGSLTAFVLASGPTIVREWRDLISDPSSAPGRPATVADLAPAIQDEKIEPAEAPANDVVFASRDTDTTADSPDDDLLPILAMSVPLSMSQAGEGANQSSACRNAVATLGTAMERRCEAISTANDGVSSSIDDQAEVVCPSCAYVADRWRCVVRTTATCNVFKE